MQKAFTRTVASSVISHTGCCNKSCQRVFHTIFTRFRSLCKKYFVLESSHKSPLYLFSVWGRKAEPRTVHYIRTRNISGTAVLSQSSKMAQLENCQFYKCKSKTVLNTLEVKGSLHGSMFSDKLLFTLSETVCSKGESRGFAPNILHTLLCH